MREQSWVCTLVCFTPLLPKMAKCLIILTAWLFSNFAELPIQKKKTSKQIFFLFPFNCTNLHAYPQMSGHSVAFVKSAALTEDLLGFGVLAELKNAKVVPLRVTLRSFCGGSNTCSSCLCESCPGNRRNTLLTHWAMSHLSLVWDVAAVVLVGWTWRTPWPFFSLLRRCACMLRACFVHVSASSTFCA